MMTWDQMYEALKEYRQTRQSFRAHANQIGSLFREVIRHASPSDLVAIKRELQSFSTRSRRWKS